MMKHLGETLSILLPVVLLTVCCCLIYVDTFHPTWRPELLLCCALRCSLCRLFYALRCCLLLLQLCLLLNHLRSSALRSFSTGLCRFRIFTLCCHLFFMLRRQLFSSLAYALSHTVFHFCYLMKRPGEPLSILLPVVLLTVCWGLLYVDTFRPT